MVRCPDCKKDLNKPRKSWNYGVFKVQAYSCECGTEFRDYSSARGCFTLKHKKGKFGWVKA